jgi:hypothetical protein
MPSLTVRRPTEVPSPRRSSKAVHAAQLEYEDYIQAVHGEVGELQLDPDEDLRSVKVRLRRAATRLGRDIETWDARGRVYFRLVPGQQTLRRRRRRPLFAA